MRLREALVLGSSLAAGRRQPAVRGMAFMYAPASAVAARFRAHARTVEVHVERRAEAQRARDTQPRVAREVAAAPARGRLRRRRSDARRGAEARSGLGRRPHVCWRYRRTQRRRRRGRRALPARHRTRAGQWRRAQQLRRVAVRAGPRGRIAGLVRPGPGRARLRERRVGAGQCRRLRRAGRTAATRAERDLRRAIELDPSNAVALAALAQREFRAGRCFEARAFSERRLAAAPADPQRVATCVTNRRKTRRQRLQRRDTFGA